MMSLGLGLSLGVPHAASSGPASNLLLWTEALDNAVWTKGAAVTITADAASNPAPPGDGSITADLVTFGGANRFLKEASAIATVDGGASGTLNINPVPLAWTRFQISCTFSDVGSYVASVYVLLSAGAGTLRLSLNGSGGFVTVTLTSITAAVSAYVWGWQLETGALATGYVPRTT